MAEHDLSEKPHVYVPPGEIPPIKLMIEDLVEGDGPTATSGDTVDVHYVGVSWKTRQQLDRVVRRSGARLGFAPECETALATDLAGDERRLGGRPEFHPSDAIQRG